MREKRTFAERTKVLKSDEVKRNIFWFLKDQTQKLYILIWLIL